MQAVILAAGRGKRLYPITANRTKAMVPIVGKPVVARVMDPMINNGIEEFILVTSPEDGQISTYFQSAEDPRLKVKLLNQPEPLGMGHALLQAKPYIQGDFLLSSCDNLVSSQQIFDLLTAWNTRQPNAILTTLLVGPNEIVRMGIIAKKEDRIIRIVEKPTLEEAPSNIGSVPLYVFSNKVLDYLSEIKPSPRGEYELQDAVQKLIDQDGDVIAHRLSDRVDLTNTEDLLSLNLSFLSTFLPRSECHTVNIGENSQLTKPFFIEKEVRIGSHCHLGPNVYIETGARIGNSVHLENVVVLRHRKIPAGTWENDKVIW